MKQNHKFQSFRKKYGRYQIHMTQHMFVRVGVKRYGPINWIIYLDDEHIVLNTYIKDHKIKINEAFLDEHWNIFVTKYNYNIDVWSMVEGSTIEEFNDYRDYLLPDKSNITLGDFDETMKKITVIENEKATMLRKVGKMANKIAKMEEEIVAQLSEMREEIRRFK